MNMEKYFEETCVMNSLPNECIYNCKRCTNYSPNIEEIRQLDLERPKNIFEG